MIRGLTGFFFISFLLMMAGCAGSGRDGSADSAAGKTSKSPDSAVIVLMGQMGKSVLEITAKQCAIEYKDSPMGVFVHMIDSLEAGSGYAWVYTVNDVPGQVAADRCLTADSDTIRWHFREH